MFESSHRGAVFVPEPNISRMGMVPTLKNLLQKGIGKISPMACCSALESFPLSKYRLGDQPHRCAMAQTLAVGALDFSPRRTLEMPKLDEKSARQKKLS